MKGFPNWGSGRRIMAKTIFVCLTAGFLAGICTDSDPNHPNGPDVIITQGKGSDRPVFEVAENVYIKEKIREGILEEVRDFDGVPRNSPEHPGHIDNPANKPKDDKDVLSRLDALAAPAGYSEDDVQGIVARALESQAQKNFAAQQKAIDDAVAKAVAGLKTA